ncbi:hypothetical protein CSB09_00590 [Candidatus Gracilibacteria bacterium]|nr:MAG: hypothetical protein CSB09_00590 [Candidatus Gracilibacteria bacterium]
MQQIIHIHGGSAFDSYEQYLFSLENFIEFSPEKKEKKKKWKERYEEFLGEENYQILRPCFPCSDNAKFREWKMYFEKVLPYIEENCIIVAHSLGGIFITKYLSENTFPKTISGLHLVAPLYSHTSQVEQIGDFRLADNWEQSFAKNSIKKIFLYHSTDDTICPVEESKKYHEKLPQSKLQIFADRFHFIGEDFPELFENIQR